MIQQNFTKPIEQHETWQTIPEFNFYEISNMGRVKCNKFRKTIFMKSGDNGKGYKSVCLHQNGKSKKFYIHRLVAMAFIPNPDNKPYVNHIDNNPANNSFENLEWCSQQENLDWMTKQGRNKRTTKWLEHLRESKVKDYAPVIATNIKTGETIYFSKLNAVKERGFFPSNVCRCCQGKAIQHKGYTFQYATERFGNE